MKNNSFALWIFFLLCAMCVVQLAYYYPQLPARVATHFGAGGEADGWSGKESFLTVFVVILLFMVVIFLGVPAAISRLGASAINLPNKKYWMAPERKAEAVRILSDYFLWFGNATLALLIVALQMTIRANLEPPHRLDDGFLIVVLAYLAFAATATVWLLLRFRRRA